MEQNINNSFDSIKTIIQSEIATAKLFIIRYGLNINGDELAAKIDGYPQKYRTKRAKKKLKLQDAQLFDSQTGIVPYIPEEIYLAIAGRETVVKVNFNPESEFKLIIEDGALLVACPQIDVKWHAKLSLKPSFKEIVIDGFPSDSFVQIIGADRIAILGYDGCEEFYSKRQCLFCDSNPIRLGEKSARPTLNQLHKEFHNNIELWLKNANKYIDNCRDVYHHIIDSKSVNPHQHLHIMAGNLPDSDREWEYMIKLSRELSSAKPLAEVDSYLNLLPPINPMYIDQTKELGFKKLIFNLEVYGADRFKAICPGKQAVMPYQTFIERMIHAVGIFGIGNVYCGFVLGAQPIDELKDGVLFLADHGVVTDYTVFTPKKGTAWEHKKQPLIEDVAEFSVFLSSVYKKFGYTALYCSLSSRSSIVSEL